MRASGRPVSRWLGVWGSATTRCGTGCRRIVMPGPGPRILMACRSPSVPSWRGCGGRTQICGWIARSCGGLQRFRPGDDTVSRFRAVEELQADYAVKRLCQVVEVSRSGYYAWRTRPAPARAVHNEALLVEIRRIQAESRGTYGSPRVHGQLLSRGSNRDRASTRAPSIQAPAHVEGLRARSRPARRGDQGPGQGATSGATRR